MKTNKQTCEQPKELYLKIPYHILNIPDIGPAEKMLLAHFYSFGKKGCWQSNATLAEIFMTTPRTIQRWLAAIQRAKLIYVKSPKGLYRTIWVKSHRDVAESVKLHYRNQQIPKPENETIAPLTHDKSDVAAATNLASKCDKSGFVVRQNCRTTNNKTIKETIAATRATPSPLPAGGQAPALLEQRKAERDAVVATFYAKFGRVRKSYTPLPPEEFERRRREALEQMKTFSDFANRREEKAVSVIASKPP